MISNYKYILLDVDGVVLSSINYYMDLFRDIAESLGAPKSIPNEFYRKHIGVKIITWLVKIVPAENHHKIRDLFFEKNKRGCTGKDKAQLGYGNDEGDFADLKRGKGEKESQQDDDTAGKTGAIQFGISSPRTLAGKQNHRLKSVQNIYN